MILKKGVVGVGIVVRDHLGSVLGWASIPFFGFLSPRTTEAPKKVFGFCYWFGMIRLHMISSCFKR